MPERLALHVVGNGKWELLFNGKLALTIQNSDRAGFVPYSTVLLPASARSMLRSGDNAVALRLSSGKQSSGSLIDFQLLQVDD